MLVEQVAGAF